MIDSLIVFLKSASGRALILSHQNADPDAIASSVSLKAIISKINPKFEVDLGAIDGVSRLSNKILTEYKIELLINPALEYYDCIIIVDTSTLDQLGDIAQEFCDLKGEKELIVIDHHAPNKKMQEIAGIYVADDNATSTSEIIYFLAKEIDVDISEFAPIILCGIISDTGHFRYANVATFEHLVDIINNSDVDYRAVIEMLEMPKDPSLRMAQIKGAQRMQYYKVNDYIVAITTVGAFEGVVSRSILRLGADVSFVYTQKKEKIRVSVRARENVINETGLHLGEMMIELGAKTTGAGGGHAAAAGANGIVDIEETKKKFLDLCKKELVKVK